jgi:hypothetical protein
VHSREQILHLCFENRYKHIYPIDCIFAIALFQQAKSFVMRAVNSKLKTTGEIGCQADKLNAKMQVHI